MRSKKILFFIVEGLSEQIALDVPLTKLYSENDVHIHIFHGDITTERGSRPSTIKKNVAQIVRSYAKRNHLSSKDFSGIIHIVDMDGAYISDDFIIEDPSISDNIFYSEKCILARNKFSIEERNLLKRSNINVLRSCDELWSVPYKIIYMSSNLDHVLHNLQMSDDQDKKRNSYLFARKYKDDPRGFYDFFVKSEFSVKGNYSFTWDFITKELNSLKRYTNMSVVLPVPTETED